MFQRLWILAMGTTICCLALPGCAVDLPLVDFNTITDSSMTAAPDTQVEKASRGGKAILRVTTQHAWQWPGVSFPAPSGKWDVSAYDGISVDVQNTGKSHAVIYCRVDSGSIDDLSQTLSGSIMLKPGKAGTITVPIERRALDVKLFGMRFPSVVWPPVDSSRITRVTVFVMAPKQDHVFEITRIRASGVYKEPEYIKNPERFFPFVDTFGQYMHKDWPGKTHSLSELLSNDKSEKTDLKRSPGPMDRDKYGGWLSGPILKATGYFRTDKHSGKWWLVDPDGRLFFSNGIDCVGMKDITPIDERDSWFENF
ncbi:MAG: hypothetical protein ACYC0V_19560, partial [Armatimonadota bacterium]